MESLGNQFVGANPPVPKAILRDQRRAVRQKVHTPAYASLQGQADDSILDLCEILDISERGALLQTPKGWQLGSALDLLLDFSETQTKVRTKGEVVWTDAGGRVGVRFPELSDQARRQLQEWLFLNVMVAAANHSVGVMSPAAVSAPPPVPVEPAPLPEQMIPPAPEAPVQAAPAAVLDLPEPPLESAGEILEDAAPIEEAEPLVRADYTTGLSALAAVQREVEGLGANYAAAMQLVAERARSLTRASGAAVAAEENTEIICRGSAGFAPPVGSPLDRNAGISGRCIKTGLLQRCDDAEHDLRVDRESCRELGIRSILAVPVRLGNRVMGLVEVFSPESHAFGEFDASVLQRLSETVQSLVNRRTRSTIASSASEPAPQPPSTSWQFPEDEPLFASVQTETPDAEMSFLHRHLIVLVAVAALILVVLVYLLALSRRPVPEPAPAPASFSSGTTQPSQTVVAAPPLSSIEEIRKRAQEGDPHAQFALATRYAIGDDEPQDYGIAARWFLKAAEQGMVLAQDTLGAYYWAGRGVPKDVVKAYYWSSVAKEGGNSASEVRVQFLTPQLTREQAAAIQRQALEFFRQHPPLKNEIPR